MMRLLRTNDQAFIVCFLLKNSMVHTICYLNRYKPLMSKFMSNDQADSLLVANWRLVWVIQQSSLSICHQSPVLHSTWQNESNRVYALFFSFKFHWKPGYDEKWEADQTEYRLARIIRWGPPFFGPPLPITQMTHSRDLKFGTHTLRWTTTGAIKGTWISTREESYGGNTFMAKITLYLSLEKEFQKSPR